MKKINLSHVIAVSASVLSLILASSAEAILYSVSGSVTNSPVLPSGSIIGTFEYDSNTSNYSNWNLTISGVTTAEELNITYNTNNSFIGTTTNANLTLFLNGSDSTLNGDFQYVALRFSGTLPTTTGSTTNLVAGSARELEPSITRVIYYSGLDGATKSISGGVVTAQAVPLDTNALPALIGLSFAGAGIWLKGKKSKNDFSLLIKED